MSETAATELKAVAMGCRSSDKEALAQIEKWMAMIREISRERQSEAKKSATERLEIATG